MYCQTYKSKDWDGFMDLKPRLFYLQQLIDSKDNDYIKIITGIRHAGKTCLLHLMVEHLLTHGVSDEQIVMLNFDSLRYKNFSYEDFFAYVEEKLTSLGGRRAYIFFDELQQLKDWQRAVMAFYLNVNCDIYIAGSTTALLDSDQSRNLRERMMEITVYPLSFSEFLEFHDSKITKSETPSGYAVRDKYGNLSDAYDALHVYCELGGMPEIEPEAGSERALTIIDGIYASIVLHGILEEEEQRSLRNLTDAVLLRKVTYFLAHTLGECTSNTAVSKMLGIERLFSDDSRQNRPATQTIQAYIKALKDCYFFTEVKRFDIRNRENLKTLTKFYIADPGLRNYLMGMPSDLTGILENITCFELRRRGYELANGKLGRREIHFIAARDGEVKYIQLASSTKTPQERRRAVANLSAIPDHYEKIIITLAKGDDKEVKGIKILSALEFFLGDTI